MAKYLYRYIRKSIIGLVGPPGWHLGSSGVFTIQLTRRSSLVHLSGLTSPVTFHQQNQLVFTAIKVLEKSAHEKYEGISEYVMRIPSSYPAR